MLPSSSRARTARIYFRPRTHVRFTREGCLTCPGFEPFTAGNKGPAVRLGLIVIPSESDAPQIRPHKDEGDFSFFFADGAGFESDCVCPARNNARLAILVSSRE